MTEIPQRLFKAAVECGFVCIPSETGDHCIRPKTDDANWQLICQKGRWMLIVHGTPQMYFEYDDVMKFLHRASASMTSVI